MIDRRQLVAGAAALGGCATAAEPQGNENAVADAMLAGAAEALLAEYPENASALGLDTGARATLKARLTDRSAAARTARAGSARARLAQLRALDLRRLSGQTRVNLEAALYAHQTAAEGYRFPYGDVNTLDLQWAYGNTPYTINQLTSFFSGVPSLLDTNHPIEEAADVDAYVARLEGYAAGLEAEAERTRAETAQGVVPPDFVCDLSLSQREGERRRAIAEWTLVTSPDAKARAKGLGDAPGRRAAALCEERVAPALDRQIAALREARAKATPDAGVWKQPDGEAWYAWGLKASTTTALTPDEVHRQGLEENAALKAEMEPLLRARGLTQGSVGARLAALGREPSVLYPNTDEGRRELLAYLNAVTADVRARMPRAFANLPAAPMEIRRVPAEIEAGAPNGYASAGPIDGSRPGIYYINLRDTGNWPKFSLPTLTYHEGVPGHIWQGSYQNRLPLILTLLSFNAYTEGWALYAETLADELGVYADDPLGRLGYLQSLQFRACRLVVDTGMHSKRWDQERCVRYMVEETGRPEDAMRSEVRRYAAIPGQACGYKVGHTEVLRLRAAARSRLGARYDGRAFNDTLIANGSVPLAVLEQIVARHVAERQ